VNKNFSWRKQSRAVGFYFLVALILLAAGKSLFAQDIVLSDFEETNYVWLPGGNWTVTGNAFGTGPAHGALSGQNAVTGFLGGGLANSYNGGDAGNGTLLSPTFTIQRNYIKFLIGGGSYRGEGGYGGETRIDLLVNGQVVRHAAGPGEWENLDWEQWNVSSLLGQTAQIRIVDTATAGWGHINVDQIVESDSSLTTGVITPTNQFINFPVKLGNPYHVVALLVNGLAVQEFNLPLGTATNNDFYTFLDLSAYQNMHMVVRVDSTNGVQLADFIQSNAPVTTTPFYQESLRPVYHFSARRGFINDPNGMVYYNGQYHLCYQHNPYDVVVGNQNWGNAVSTDLVHWQELPEAIYGDALGQAWSGSSVVDWNNSAGFGTNAIVSFYTSAGGHSNNNLMSQGQLFGQSMAYSLDQGQTWTKYTNNPVVPNVEGDNRDPKVIWYAPGNKWVMVFWLQNTDFGFFSSTDLKHWTQTSTFTFGNGVIEVPELFPLALDGNTNNQKWIFYAGAGNYYVGTFDGNTFTAQNEMYFIRKGNSFAAGQTFNNIPAADGRRILIANGTQNYPNMPFQCAMDFPVELTLNTVGGVPQMLVNPVRELSALRISTNTWPAQALADGVNVMPGTYGEAFDLDATFQPSAATSVTFNLRGATVTYNCGAQTVTCAGTTQSLAPSNGIVHLQMLVDRGIIEIFGNGGQLYMPMSVTAIAGMQTVSLTASGSGATLSSLAMHNLGPAFNYVSNSVPDLLLSDFEQTNYVWLPGGVWTATGTAFGSGPAQGTLNNQQTVGGYFGNGLVNTYLNGDGSTGTLTSPPFIIQRNYIKFLIGGGNLRGQTCMNLLVNGQVVRSATGMGDREQLDWLQWNVSAFSNQTAQIQIVDSATNSFGHINVDEIMETDVSLPNVIVATNHYLNLPIRTGAPKHLVELVQDGLVVREMNVELADTATNFFAFMDLTPLQGTELVVRVDSQLATSNQLATYFIQTNTIITDTPIYQEALRPIYHYTARRGWVNDANGMVYYNGEYHLCYQHNLYGWAWDNMHWGNAVSTNLVNWTELPEALYPDNLGTEFSGSAVVDWNNSAGFGTNALVAFFTGAGGNNRMSINQPSTQCMAYSLDLGRTWTKYTNNPVITNIAAGNRDPKVIWYAPGNKWVMALYLINNDFAFFSSTDLKHWTQTSTFTFPGASECPEIFPLPLDGNTNNLRWIFWSGGGHYDVGQFDGNAFTVQSGPNNFSGGNNFYAAQTFNNIPASDGRRLLIAWANGGSYPNMPFNNAMTFPVELTLATVNGTPLVCANPAREIAQLRISTNTWPAQALADGVNAMPGATGEAFELDALFQPGSASQITFTLRGTSVVYDNIAHQITCSGISQPLNPSNGVVHLRMLVDRGILEIFGNDGLVYMPMSVIPIAGALPLSLVASGSGAQLVSLNFYNLGSAWNSPATTSVPTIITSPTSATANLGGPALFSITASGVGPLYYQWFANGQPIFGATNSSLAIFPATGTNLNYDVVVSNAGGSVTSSVVTLTILPPYQVAYWRMEAQITAPNNAGTPTFTGVADADTNSGQGIFTTGTLPAAIDDLITFNGLSGNPVTLSTNVAPASMFVNGHNAGNFSHNAEAITNVDGALFFPQDQYGDELDFTGPFSLELFFKTDGNRSGAGVMQLVSQGTDNGQTFRYGINVNEASAGGIRFKIANSILAQTNSLDLTGTNYADGQWHYLLAVCDTLSGTNGQMRLTIANQDGSQASATNNLPSGFLPLPTANNGNLFLGRYSYPVSQTPRTFLGFIDEVQISSGVISDSARIGKIPSSDNHPMITGVSCGTNGVSFQWTGAAATNFVVQWVGQLGNVWQSIAMLPSAGSLGIFVDTNVSRLNGAAGFYRILSH
jgi:fructan beta-fructosidase